MTFYVNVYRASIVIAALLLILTVIPYSWLDSYFPCVFKDIVGIECPGCGLLRSWAHLLHLDWHKSFALYPLGPLILLGVLGYLLDELRILIGAGQVPIIRPIVASQWMVVLPGLILIQWIAKLVGLW